MILDIHHKTTYQYDTPVFPEPHHLYFYPSAAAHIKVLDVEIRVAPDPAGLATRKDAENNLFHQCWFGHEISELVIDASQKVEVRSFNPFDFLIESESAHRLNLNPYLTLVEKLDTSLINWLKDLLTGNDVLSGLVNLNSQIGQEWGHDIRYREGLLSVAETFYSRKGSCRDLAWMMIHLLRHEGIPTRFVSGYAFNPDLGAEHELHAWVECFLPGAGWIGFDPTAGILIDEHYIPVASSYEPKFTLPVQGTFRGSAQTQLSFEVDIQKSDPIK